MYSYLWTDVLVYNLSNRAVTMGSADAPSMGYTQIVSAEKLDFTFAGQYSLSSWSESH